MKIELNALLLLHFFLLIFLFWVKLEMAPDEPPTKLKPDSDARPTREELISPVQPVRHRAKGVKPQPSATSTPIDSDKHKASEAEIAQGQV